MTYAQPLPSYNVNPIKSKLESLVKSHDYTEEDPQTILVDCIVADTHLFSDEEKCSIVCKKLGLECAASFQECEEKIDSLAEQITAQAGMPGKFVFIDDGQDLCLVYAFERPNIQNTVAKMVKKVRDTRKSR